MIVVIMRNIIYFFTLFFITIANASQIWQSTYYAAIPNKKTISTLYCKQHEPGTFVGNVHYELKYGVITNHHLYLNHFTFHIKIKHGIYFMHGHFIAEKNHISHDVIHYNIYKLTRNGVTRGVWYNRDCKGFYIGKLIKK
ncbi:MAG: hypothetical protein A3E81_02125 [Gammaproteobacteria bacterium RIFCSPHIGHO2_12_FULL_36_30]|nr:MAG: hypothetical protein A3E81_02125 [Gammaproteobacteria bacterium RIFCSPHIGHO2_12_FULL_36_30]